MSVPQRRGRPPKFGRPATLVALALPDDVLVRLKDVNADLGHAIVSLVEHAGVRRRRAARQPPLIELARVFAGQSLIFVNPERLPRIPGVVIVPVAPHRALLALEEPGGLAELELAVRRALDEPLDRGAAELRELATQLREWRSSPRLKVAARHILVVGRKSAKA